MNDTYQTKTARSVEARGHWRLILLIVLVVSLFASPVFVGAQEPVPNADPPLGGQAINLRPVALSDQELAGMGSPNVADGPAATAPNLLTNPGFELDANGDGKPDSWSVDNRVVRDGAVKHGGAFAMRHQALDNSSYILKQDVTGVAVGKDYAFSAWVNIPATDDAFAFRMDIVWRNGTTVLGTTALKTFTAATVGWQRASATMTPPANTTNVVARMAASSLNATIYVDDLMLVEAPKATFFVDPSIKTTSAGVAVDARGGSHLALAQYAAYADHPPAYYLYCPPPADGCTAFPGKWRGVRFPDYVDEVQLVLTPTGQPRLLVDMWRSGFNSNQFVYWECPSVCTDGARWKGLIVAQPGGVDVFMDDNPQRSFALDHQGRPRFVYSNGWGNGRPVGVYYAYCNSNCATPGAWFETQIYQGPEFKSLAFEYPALKFTTTGQPRLVSNMTFSGIGQGVLYLQCDTNCGTLSGWKGVKLFDRGGGTSASWDLELDGLNRPRIAFYQAALTNGGGEQLFYASCNTNCLTAASWKRVSVGLNKGDGRNADLELDAAGQPRIAYEDYYPLGNIPGLGYAWCNAACETTASWKRQTIDPSSALNAEFPVAKPFHCDTPSWLKAIPVLALNPAGDPRIAYDAINVATCHYTDHNGQSYTKVEQLWRSVRTVFATQP